MTMKVIKLKSADLSVFKGSNLVSHSEYNGYSLILVPHNFGYGDQLYRGSRSSCEKFLSYMKDTRHGTSETHILELQRICSASEKDIVSEYTFDALSFRFSAVVGLPFLFGRSKRYLLQLLRQEWNRRSSCKILPTVHM